MEIAGNPFTDGAGASVVAAAAAAVPVPAPCSLPASADRYQPPGDRCIIEARCSFLSGRTDLRPLIDN